MVDVCAAATAAGKFVKNHAAWTSVPIGSGSIGSKALWADDCAGLRHQTRDPHLHAESSQAQRRMLT